MNPHTELQQLQQELDAAKKASTDAQAKINECQNKIDQLLSKQRIADEGIHLGMVETALPPVATRTSLRDWASGQHPHKHYLVWNGMVHNWEDFADGLYEPIGFLSDVPPAPEVRIQLESNEDSMLVGMFRRGIEQHLDQDNLALPSQNLLDAIRYLLQCLGNRNPGEAKRILRGAHDALDATGIHLPLHQRLENLRHATELLSKIE
jgi:hypothetical protein